jgi:hypothetical protein
LSCLVSSHSKSAEYRESESISRPSRRRVLRTSLAARPGEKTSEKFSNKNLAKLSRQLPYVFDRSTDRLSPPPPRQLDTPPPRRFRPMYQRFKNRRINWLVVVELEDHIRCAFSLALAPRYKIYTRKFHRPRLLRELRLPRFRIFSGRLMKEKR